MRNCHEITYRVVQDIRSKSGGNARSFPNNACPRAQLSIFIKQLPTVLSLRIVTRKLHIHDDRDVQGVAHGNSQL